MEKPLIKEISFNNEELQEFEQYYLDHTEDRDLILYYPTVYLIRNENKKELTYSIYIGETNNIVQRTKQHLARSYKEQDTDSFIHPDDAKLLVIAHKFFNKSLTLDVENKLMHYLSSVKQVDTIYNRRTNAQDKYYTSEYLNRVFSKIWSKLHTIDNDLFPVEQKIKDSALFKASPFHRLNEEQLQTKASIKEKIVQSILYNQQTEENSFIFVSGEAGSGKTVLLSTLFYELLRPSEDDPKLEDPRIHLLVNHEQQKNVYKQIALKLGLTKKSDDDTICKPSRFINNYRKEKNVKADIVLIDEAHLLYTQGQQGYSGKNQLYDIMKHAKIVIAIFDENQILSTNQFWEKEKLLELESLARSTNNYIRLQNQMRIKADESTVNWVRSLVDDGNIHPIPKDTKGYKLRVFTNPNAMHQAIVEHSKNTESGISRVVATYDWPYKASSRPENSKYWSVTIGDHFDIPWNYETESEQNLSNADKKLAWAEQPHTINEIGSTYSIQGLDLNIVGVIIGPSVKYRNGKIVFDRTETKNRKASQQRTFADGSKNYISDTLLKNELNVLLTRGVNGLYIYAVDQELRNALLKAQKDGNYERFN